MLELAASKAADLTAFDHAGTARSKYSSVRERVRVKAEEQRAKMEEPTAIRLRDKLSFMLGVVGCFVIEACVLQAPQLYPYLSRVKLPPPLGRAPARLLRLLTARLAALGSSALPGRGRPTGHPATASGARASRLQSRPCPRL